MQILTKATTVRLPTYLHLQIIEIANRIRRHPAAIMRDAISIHVQAFQDQAKKENQK